MNYLHTINIKTYYKMKKSIIALMGLFTLIACSEETYQEADKMNETKNGAVENTGPQNSVKTIDTGIGYNSPFANPGMVPEYKLLNLTTNLTLRFRAYVGFGFYDGNTINPNYFGNALNSGLYPNLYAGSKKYGNLVQSNFITLTAGNTRYAKYGSVPVLVNPAPCCGVNFNLTFPASVSASEINLLDGRGKIHFIYYEILNATTGALVRSGNLYQKFVPNIGSFPGGTLPSNYQVIGTESLFNRQLLAETSSEIVVTENVAAGDFSSEINFTYGTQNYKLEFATFATQVYVALTP